MVRIRTQCQKTMSPGLTFGTLTIVLSRRMCGCVFVFGRGPLKAFPIL